MFDLLYQHPIITGTILAAIAALELGVLVFNFERYKTFFRHRRWMHLLFQESESRAVLISSALLFLTVGLAIICMEKALLPRTFCGAACVLAFVHFLGTVAYDRWRKQNRQDQSLG